MSKDTSKSVYNLFCHAVGGNKFLGIEKPGNDWSPNNIKSLVIFPDGILTEYHVGEPELFPFVGTADFDRNAVFSALDKNKRLSKLEGLFIHEAFGGGDLAMEIAGNLIDSHNYKRLHTVGSVDDAGNVLSIPTPNADTWMADITLEPEHYPFDSSQKLINALTVGTAEKLIGDSEGSEGSEGSVEGDWGDDDYDDFGEALSGDLEDFEESEVEEAIEEPKAGEEPTPPAQGTADEDEITKEIARFYGSTIDSTVDTIIRNYDYIFASGYEVIKPVGMLIAEEKNTSKGKQTIGNVFYLDESNTLKPRPVSAEIRDLYKTITKYMGTLDTFENRSNSAIAQHIVSNGASQGLYLPYKLMEYAFGRKRVTSNDASITNYEPHSDASSWSSYVSKELRPSLETTLGYTVSHILKATGAVKVVEDVIDEDVSDKVISILKDIERAFCRCLLVSTFEEVNNKITAIKLRVLDPYNQLPRDKNIIVEALDNKLNLSNNPKTRTYDPIAQGEYFVEYQVDIDEALAQAQPLFAFKALQALSRQGFTLNYDTAVIGKGIDDKILKNDGDITYKNNLSHLVMAGSRSGKGVWTLSSAAASVISRRPVFYLDNKPDIGDLINSLADNVFAINGGDVVANPEEGTGVFESFGNFNAMVSQDRVPQYVRDGLGITQYSGNFGTIVYLRSLLLTLGILSARASGGADSLGGAKGISIIADEVTNVKKNMVSLTKTMKTNWGGTKYRQEVEQGKEEITTPKPNEISLWNVYFMNMITASIQDLQRLDNAGFNNAERGRSDIFIILQDPPIPAKAKKESYLPPRLAVKNAANDYDKFSEMIVPDLIIRGSMDCFVGYHQDSNYLGQKDADSKASQYLTLQARNFAYLSRFDPDTIQTAKDANRAVYYKPLLLLPHGDEDKYFVRNLYNTIKDNAGVPPEQIREINKDENDPSRIHPAVGFQAYLEMAGMSADEIRESLNQSGDIADMVVKAMGYPDSGRGTWRKFITDLRAEWIFSTKDVINALTQGTKLKDSPLRAQEDIYIVYPELFSGGGDGVDIDLSGMDESMPIDLSGMDEGEVDLGDSGEVEYEQGGSGFGSGSGSEDFVDYGDTGNNQGTANYNDRYVVDYTGEADNFGAERGRNGDTHTWGTADTEPVTAKMPVVEGDEFSGQNFNEEELEKAKYNLLELATSLASVKRNDPRTLLNVMGEIATLAGAIQHNHKLRQGTAESQVAGKMERGRAVKFGDYRQFNADGNEDQLERLRNDLTHNLYASIGGPANFRKLAINDGEVIINGVIFTSKFRDSFIQSLPIDLKRPVSTGKVAGLIKWNSLKKTGRFVTAMSFDSDSTVRDLISPALGWKGVPVTRFFERFPALQVLKVGTAEYTRSNFKKQLSANGGAHADMGGFYNTVSAWRDMGFTKGRADFAKMKDAEGGGAKAWRFTKGSLYFAVGAASGIAGGAKRRGGNFASRLRYAMSDVNKL